MEEKSFIPLILYACHSTQMGAKNVCIHERDAASRT